MTTTRRLGTALAAVVPCAALAVGCASPRYPTAPPPAPPAAAPTPPAGAVPTPSVGPSASLAELEPALVLAEDRRSFDPVLASAAASKDAGVRARGAVALGRIGDARAVEPLRALLSDREATVRESAAFASGILGEAALSPALVAPLGDPDDDVAARAAWAIGMLGEKGGAEALSAGVRAATRPSRRAACLRGLWRYGGAATREAAAPFAADPDVAVRASALYALARRPDPASLALLTAGLSDPDARSAALCARALGLLASAESIAPLSAAIETAPGPVRIEAMLALAAVLEKTAAPAPAERRERILQLSGDVNPNVAVPALALLRWYVEDRDAFRRLWTAATTGTERRQQVALQALMGGLGARSADVLDRSLSSADPFLRAAAADALSFLPPADAAPRRERLSVDPAVVVRLKVLEGLKTPADVAGNRAIVDRLRSDADPGVRAAAVEALAMSGDGAVWAVLRDMVVASYAEKAPDVPIAAIGAAERHADSADARAVVEAAYRHPSVLVSRLARRSLVRTFGAAAADFPWRTYDTGRTASDYAVLIAEARRPWVLRVETARGAFGVRLDGQTAPLTVMNILALAGKEYFDGAPVHRVVPDFVVQDGDPTGTGNGGPGYEIRDELSERPYLAGTVGMALAGPDTGGSQWFVTQAPEPHLDGGYTVFGTVVSGMDVVLRIEQGDRIVRIAASVEKPRGQGP
ncbi:MAG: peptidylprolyl isomerase [Syntrophomonadaceae bacterium]